MHAKEQVKDFVHGIKRKLSQKHKRETSVSDSLDYSSVESHSQNDDSSSCFSMSTRSSTQERGRFLSFLRRTASTSSIKRNLFRGSKRSDSKRNRFFSTVAVPSERMVGSNYKPPASYHGTTGLRREMTGGRADYPDVIDVCVQSTATSRPSSTRKVVREASECDRESSDTSGTLVTTGSGLLKSVSASESDSVDLHSDESSETVPSMVHHEEHNVQPTRSPSPSPAPAVIPRLTAPSMFLPIPNVRPVYPVSHPLVWWLAPSSMSFQPAALPPMWSPSHSPFAFPLYSTFLPPPPGISRCHLDHPFFALLTKYVPAEQRPRRDVVGEYAGRDVHEMVMSNSWRALAKMARDRIVASDPEDLARILELWSLRLSSLARLRLTNQASAECTNLFAVLNAVQATSVPGTFPGSGSLPPAPLPSSPPSPLSPSGLSSLAQLPGTPSQKPSSFSPSLAATPHQGTSELSYPFELTVFHARVHYWSGDPLGYVDALSRILAKCKEKAREESRIVVQRKEAVKAQRGGDVGSTDEDDKDDSEGEGKEDAEESTEGSEAPDEEKEEPDEVLVAAEANVSMWLERAARVCLILASQLVEMNDYQAAINLLSPLCTYRAAPTELPTASPALHSALARVHLLSGNLQKAEQHFSIAAAAAATNRNGADIVAMNTALLAAASGDWALAEETLSEMASEDPGSFSAINNLAVTRLCQGSIKQGIDLLETVFKTSPSTVVVAEPFLFNLSTMYELRSTAAVDKKRGLLVEVAKWSGDGLKTSCLKMPSS